jgi:D-lyxose ketol-isomerase
MKRSEINHLVHRATQFFGENGWALPPNPRWDVTDFGLGDWKTFGLVLVNLSEEPEYTEKLMYAERGMTTPAHTHRLKKEDIICRTGLLHIQLWGSHIRVKRNGEWCDVESGGSLTLEPGERITLTPGIIHEFYPLTEQCIIGEVSTANDDANDNFFVNPEVGRFPGIDEDEPAIVTLVSDQPSG